MTKLCLYQKCRFGFTWKNQSKEENRYDHLNRCNKLCLTSYLSQVLNVFPQFIEEIKKLKFP